MALRVAELETVLTADGSQAKTEMAAVETRQKELDGTRVDIPVAADGTEATRTFDQIRAELTELDQATARPKLEMDVSDAQTKLEALRFELDQVDGERSEAEVLADVGDALRDLERAETALADLDSTVARPRIDPAGLQEFNSEAVDTAREAAASFDGSMSSAADAIQETLANALVGFGPVGVAAGLAAAAGIGTAITAATELAEENTAAKEAATDMAVAMVEGTHDALAAFREYATEVREDNPWTVWSDESTTALQQVADAASDAGVDVTGLLGALAEGEMEAAREGLAGLRDEQERLREVVAEGTTDYGEYGRVQSEATAAAEAQMLGLEELIPMIEEQIETADQATETAILLKQAEEGLTRAEAEAALAIEEKNRVLAEGIEGSRSVIQAEFDLADSVRATKKVTDDAKSSEQDRKEALFGLSGNILDLAAAEEEASGSTAAYNKVIDDNRREFIGAAEAAGYTRSEARKLADQYGLIPKSVATSVSAPGLSGVIADLGELQAALNASAGRHVTIPYQSNIQGRAGGGRVDAGVPYYVGDAGQTEIFVPDQPGRIIDGATTAQIVRGSSQQAPSAPLIGVLNHYGTLDERALASYERERELLAI